MNLAAPAEDILALRVENYYTGLPYGPAFPTSKYQGWPDEEKDRLWAKYWGESRTPNAWNNIR